MSIFCKTKFESLAGTTAEYLAQLPFDKSAEAVAHLWDMVNAVRDQKITRAHRVIEEIMSDPNFIHKPDMVLAIKQCNQAIKIMQGELRVGA